MSFLILLSLSSVGDGLPGRHLERMLVTLLTIRRPMIGYSISRAKYSFDCVFLISLLTTAPNM